MTDKNAAVSRQGAVWLECCLWVVGLVALGLCALVWIQAWDAQQRASHELDQILSTPGLRTAPRKLATGELVGRLEIPRLGVSSMILEGADAVTLGRGIGHLPQSPLPHATGNIVLAAHRDTFFRALENIQPADQITLTTPEGTRYWVVETTTVVESADTSLLTATKTPRLTLVTCFPFRFVGSAPQRFIVRCRELVRPATNITQKSNA